MDAVDLQILRSLVWRPDDPADRLRGIHGVWDVAADLSLHGTTVKRRIEQMQHDGVLGGVRILPNFDLLGIRGNLYLFSFADTLRKKAGFERMLPYRVPGGPFFLSRVESFVGHEAMCAVASPAELDPEAIVAQVADELGAQSWQLIERETWPMRSDRITAVDRAILLAYHQDALRPMAQVAEEVGVTPKTVRNRLRFLAEAHAFEIVPDFAPARMTGVIPHIILVQPRPGQQAEACAALFNAFPGYFLRSHPAAAPVPYVYLAAPNTKALQENLERAQRLPHQDGARLLLFEDSASCVPADGVLPPLGDFLERAIVELRTRKATMVRN
jgi:DNA-binding Lrp family transcriptional regulator